MGFGISDFENLLSDDFQTIENLLADGIFAAYLLGYDAAREENKRAAEFAEGDDEKRAERAGDLDLRFDVPPEEAIDYFRRKRIVTKKEFNKLSREAQASAFYVSGIYKKDILDAFKQEITGALESGQTQKYVVGQFKDILDGAAHRELGDFHLESVFRTNMQMAYGVGRRRQMEESADLLPFWEYSAVGDDRTRPTHRALDGIVYPAEHEFWDTHFPPWGFNCRCTIIALLDYPDGYDHNKPNENTTIAYDEKGLPAKAEYGTQVVDLKATNFVGVPRTASLEDVLKQSSERAQAAKRERDNYQTPRLVIEKAKQISRSKVEINHVFKENGEWIGEAVGDESSVFTPSEFYTEQGGKIDVHCHPKEGDRFFESFTATDIIDAIKFDLVETLAVTEKYLYSMRPPKTGWSVELGAKLLLALKRERDKLAKEFFERMRSGEMTFGEAKDIERHALWKRIAKQMKLRYKRTPLSKL